ncbi:MAG: glycosyltransferase [Myxococcota bacterium]
MYYAFERYVWQKYGDRLRQGEFDLVHRVTPVSPGVPSPIAQHCARIGRPFILGPINGGVPWPKGFEEERRKEGEWLGHLRGVYRAFPHYRSTRRHAAALIVGSAVAWREMPRSYHPKTFYMPENAVDPAQFSVPTIAYEKKPLPVAFVGRLIACKGVAMLLEAAAPLLKAGQITLDIIGDGPEKESLQRMASQHGVNTSVRLEGWVPHTELAARLAQSAVFAFPSIREFGGAVVMEAMMLGLVPVVVDYGGPTEVVSEDTGFRVPLTQREDVIVGLRRVFEKLVAMPSADVEAMGKRCRQRIIDNFSLTAKAQKTARIYQWALSPHGERPPYYPPAHALTLY